MVSEIIADIDTQSDVLSLRRCTLKKMYSSRWKPLLKDTNFVLKIGASILLFALAFMLLYNRTSDFSPVSDSPFPESADQILRIQETGAESVDNGGECDIFAGDWVRDEAGPVYNRSCSFITDHQNCIKNGRPDKYYLYWRWKPRGCELPRFDAARFLELMRNKSWAFVGDSISRNHIQSLLCILSTVENAIEVYHDPNFKSETWLFPSYNFTASVIWSPFLAKAIIPEDPDGASAPEIDLYLDVLDKNWTEHYNDWDYIIFSSGKWFSRSAMYYENNAVLGCHYCPKRNLTDLGFDFAYRKVIKNVLDFIMGSDHKGMIFFRSITPDHFEGGEWYDGGTCRRKVPAREGEFELSWVDRTIRDIEVEELANATVRAFENGVNFRYFDVNPMSLLRPDGHPGPFRFYQPFGEDKNAKVISDCMHWCLPGPIDAWNDLLMQLIVSS